MPLRPRLARLMVVLMLLSATAWSDNRALIDQGADRLLGQLRNQVPGAGELLDAAAGVLVFPEVVTLSFAESGSYGEGALQVDSAPVAYYATARSVDTRDSGGRYRAELVLFMTEEALRNFRDRRAWEVGVDGRVAMLRAGTNGSIERESALGPVLGLIYSESGLDYNLDLDGSRFVRLARR